MRHWVSNLPIPPVQRWQSRAEILKEHIEQQEFARLFSLKLALQSIKQSSLAQKFDPDQPRMPAGNPGGGQWTNGGAISAGQQPMTLAARRNSRARESECALQYRLDTIHCTMVGLSQCHAQAALRYANCLADLPIPPLNY